MDQIKKEEFLKLSDERKRLTDQIKELAWLLTTDEIKELLIGEKGLCPNERNKALNWLIKPLWRLDEKSPAEAIADGQAEKVKEVLNQLVADTYS